MFRLGLTWIILITGLRFGSGTVLDIKEFLGEEPLTKRRIIEDVLKYFQQDHPQGIPVLNVPDKIEIEGPISTTQMTLGNLSISGHSGITLQHVDVNLQKLQFQIRLNIPSLEIIGNYEWPGYWANSIGDLNITIVNLDVGAIVDFGITDEGNLEVIDMESILTKKSFLPNLTGLTTQHFLLVSAADSFFDFTVLPFIQSSIRTKGMAALNDRLRDRLSDVIFPVDISPIDYAIAKVRSDIIRERNLDPKHIDDREMSFLALSLVLKNIEIRGLSSLHRSDLIRVEFVDNRFYITVEIGTQKLQGTTDWSLFSSLFPLGTGHAVLTIEYLRVSVELQQEADVRHPPILRRIDIELGNIALRSAGERNVDYMLEAMVNLLPNALRNTIMDRRVEGKLRKIIQDKFNTINVEHIIEDYLDKMDAKEKAT